MLKLNRLWLRNARLKAHVPIEAAAMAVGKTRGTIWRYERDRGNIDVDTLCKMLDCYGAKLEDVFCVVFDGEKGNKNDSI